MTTLDFELPRELEAREPAELRGAGRDDVRLLVSVLADDELVHAHFRDLPRFLRPDDLLVLNTTATLPAALSAIRDDGDVIALHVSMPIAAGLFVVEPRVAGREPAKTRERFALPDELTCTLLAPYRDSQRLWIASIGVADMRAYLARYGRPIHYSYIERPYPLDAYQTVFADAPGSAEMPSAGRAFTREMLVCLRRSGVRLAKLVLHAGVASLEAHERPYEEHYEVPLRTAEEVRRAKARGGRVIAVGTTVVRALESSVDRDGRVIASRGWTDLVITPERGVRVVDSLLTGLHEPRATHLAMLEAIAGRTHIERAYAAAVAEKYLWHEFGDLHLLL
ncbi:MAG TPA: S-adenosylmethionine:tRNA ribosyltransferase-isomerase [Thermoanaerobaculia bacterium]|nr:S-adenosylmethionine:tRNA ribosyltransferase-isomerase [Thermoanaerobaculia bacterium]